MSPQHLSPNRLLVHALPLQHVLLAAHPAMSMPFFTQTTAASAASAASAAMLASASAEPSKPASVASPDASSTLESFFAAASASRAASASASAVASTSAKPSFKLLADNVDDVGFIGALLDHLESLLCTDRRRVFASGMSNGAIMGHRLACEMPQRVRKLPERRRALRRRRPRPQLARW